MCSLKNRGNEYKVVNFYIVFNLYKWNLHIMLKNENKYNRIHKYDEIIKVQHKFFSYLYKTKIYYR